MRTVVVQSGQSPFADDCPGGETENVYGKDEQSQHCHLHVVRLDFLAEIFWCPADHQAGDEDGEHDEHEHSVQSGADAAEDNLAELNIEQGNETAERHERIVH